MLILGMQRYHFLRSDPIQKNSEAAVTLSPTHDKRQTGSHSFPMESSAIWATDAFKYMNFCDRSTECDVFY